MECKLEIATSLCKFNIFPLQCEYGHSLILINHNEVKESQLQLEPWKCEHNGDMRRADLWPDVIDM